MNEAFFDRLNQCNITVKDILNAIEKKIDEQIVFAYTSQIEGLGTKESDLDIYVLSKNLPSITFARESENRKVQISIIKDTVLDIEYWSIDNVAELIDKINSSDYGNLNVDELKLLHRLKVSEILCGVEEGMQIKKSIEESKLQECVKRLYILFSNSELQDAIQLFNSEEYISANNRVSISLENAIGALNAKNGITNLKQKWIAKKFLSNGGYNEELLKKYLKYQGYPSINEKNIKSFVEGKIEFTQDILASITLENISKNFE